jgi:hypothetical protein
VAFPPFSYSLAALEKLPQCFCWLEVRVARWKVYLHTKIPIWVYFGGPCNEKCWYIFGPLVYFTVIPYILWSFGMFHGHLVYYILVYFLAIWYVAPRKIWQPCLQGFTFFESKMFSLIFLNRAVHICQGRSLKTI